MRSLWLAIFLALLACVPAEAATTVARVGELNLRAQERNGRICITLRRERVYQGERCGRIPRSPQRAMAIFPDAFVNHYAAAVPPTVRVAEVETRRGARERHGTFKARGFSARFVLIPAPPAPVFVRFYSASGRLLGIDAGLVGYITSDSETLVAEGVEASTEPLLAPTPDDPDRLTTVACVGLENSSGGTGSCDSRAPNEIAVLGECEAADLVAGIVAPGVAGVRLTLGSGGEFTLPSRALPAVFGGRRAVTGLPPRGQAVRSAVALDASGTVVGRTRVGTEPSGQPCLGEEQGGSGFGGPLRPAAPPPGAVAVASAGGASLLVADQGDRLCAGLGRLSARICPPPPVDSDRPRLLRRDRAVGGVLSRDAARVTLRLDRGPAVTVRTTDGAAYTGAWTGDVRFFAATVPDRREIVGAVVRNRRGRIIGISARGIVRRAVHRRVLAREDGAGFAMVRREGEQPCLTPFATDLPPARQYCTDLTPGMPIDGPVYPYSAAIAVPCDPRRVLAYGRMPDRYAPPRILLEGDRSVRARRIAVRGEDIWIAVGPGDSRVLGLRSGNRDAALDLPPASAQCGYSLTRAF